MANRPNRSETGGLTVRTVRGDNMAVNKRRLRLRMTEEAKKQILLEGIPYDLIGCSVLFPQIAKL